ncbi:hypothetical protein BYT27DRAFT_7249899 [Phlegmacium glaucopus]|nr:hypothetical protein BYT27DRAFT_7249899 [Phlegmacium glaucopus]
MQLVPGPLYLLRTFPYFAVPSTIVYAGLTLAKEHLSLPVPSWLALFIALLARPTIFIFNKYYSRLAESRNAAANNAIVAPHVRESAFTIISKIAHSYPNFQDHFHYILREGVKWTSLLIGFFSDSRSLLFLSHGSRNFCGRGSLQNLTLISYSDDSDAK